MPIEKLRPAFTFTEDRLKELQAVVPEAFADGKINWDVLREALGEHLEDESQEHFGLFWPGKRAARRLAALPSKGTLIPQPGEGVNEDTTHNIFIEGDNLEVLKLLQKSYAGRVKLIYIDPPYNTGNDFIYSDNFVDPIRDYLEKTGQINSQGHTLTTNAKTGGRYHSNWLNMLYPRLLLARKLLSEEGSIFISIDDNELPNLRAIMNEIFGEENFIATIIWQKVFSPKNTARHFSEDHDYIVIYASSGDLWTPNLLPRSDEADARYQNPDNDPRGPWSSSDLTARNYYGAGMYEVVSPSGKRFTSGIGRYWRSSYENFKKLDADNRVWWGAAGSNMPRLKRFLSEVKQGIVPQTLWQYEDVGHTQEAKKELLAHVDFEQTENVLNTVKPTRLIKRIIALATDPQEQDIVMDFFAGSGTTAHAVLEQNSEDNGNRRFILIQFPEPLPKPEPTLKTIADITKQRVRKVIAKINSKEIGQNDFNDILGFASFELAPSNYREWDFLNIGDLEQLQLRFEGAETPLVTDWQPTNLLTEILLLQGFPLDSRIRPLPEFPHNQVQAVTSDFCRHHLYVCLDAAIHPTTAATLSLRPEDVFVCLDSALSDEAKLTLADRCNLKVI